MIRSPNIGFKFQEELAVVMRVVQLRDRIDPVLSRGLHELSMTLGVLARIDSDVYEVFAVKSDAGVYVPGDRFALGDTLCRRVFEGSESLAVANLEDISIALSHPLYLDLPLESYIGAPVYQDDAIWGCVDFTSMAPRDKPFSQEEIDKVTGYAREIGEILATE